MAQNSFLSCSITLLVEMPVKLLQANIKEVNMNKNVYHRSQHQTHIQKRLVSTYNSGGTDIHLFFENYYIHKGKISKHS